MKRKKQKNFGQRVLLTQNEGKVEELAIEELKQLVAFYKQKSSDLEYNMLITQLKLNKALAEQVSVVENM